jgi:hypothetical protein
MVRVNVLVKQIKFNTYKSNSGKLSGVTGYILGKDHIVVRFRGTEIYVYSYASAGKETIEEMKRLAMKQNGLSTFISQNDPPYEH